MSPTRPTREVVIEQLQSTGRWRYVGGAGPLQWADLDEADRTGEPPRAYSLEVALDRELHYEAQDD